MNHPSVHLDIAVFVLVTVQTQLVKSLHCGVGVPSILDTISRDAGIYFAVIASSHFLVVVLYSAARVRPFAKMFENAC